MCALAFYHNFVYFMDSIYKNCRGEGGGGVVHDRNVPSDTAIAKAHNIMMLNNTGCTLGIKS